VNESDVTVFTWPALTVFALLTVIFIAARLWHLSSYTFWADEIFSVTTAREDWGPLFQKVVSDLVHPPLFYMLLKIWMLIGGESAIWLHLLPTLAAIASIVPFFLLSRELNLRPAELNLTFLLMAVNGYLIYYSFDLRMYSLLLLLTLFSLWLFARFFNSEGSAGKTLPALFAVNLLLVYTHYYGWVLVGIEFIFLFFWGRQKLRSFSIIVAALILSFSPWFYLVAREASRYGGVRNLSWMPQPGATAVGDYFGGLHGSFQFAGQNLLGLLLFGVPIVLWAWRVMASKDAEGVKRRATFWWLVLLSFLPVVLSFSLSQRGNQSVWNSRYLIIAAVPYMLLIAISVFRLPPKWVRTAALLLVTGWAILGGFQNQSFADRQTWEPMGPLVKKMVQTEPSQGRVGVYVFDRRPSRAIRLYLRLHNATRFQLRPVDDVEAIRTDHFWVATQESRDTKFGSLQGRLEAQGYQVGEGLEANISAEHKVVLLPVWRKQPQR